MGIGEKSTWKTYAVRGAMGVLFGFCVALAVYYFLIPHEREVSLGLVPNNNRQAQKETTAMLVSKDDLYSLLSSFKSDIIREVKEGRNDITSISQNVPTLVTNQVEDIQERRDVSDVPLPTVTVTAAAPALSSPSSLIYIPDRERGELADQAPEKKYDVLHPDGEKPRIPPGPRPKFVPGDDKSTIFIAIASYRDKMCAGTLLSMYKKAEYPERVYVGLVQQLHPKAPEEDCLYYCTEQGAKEISPELKEEAFQHLCPRIHSKQITDMRMPQSYAKGVMYARHNAQWLLQNQDFAIMMDAHSEFEYDWDSLMIANWNEIGNEMAVISTYPKNFKIREDESTWDKTPTIPQLCRSVFRPNGIPRHQSAIEVRTSVSHISPFWGACFAFSKAHAWRRCTFDPYSFFAFDPEEFFYGIRLWTHGYDMYTPSYNYIYHQYYGPETEKHSKREMYHHAPTYKDKAVERVNARIRYILGGRVRKSDNPDLREIEHYGLGDVRSLEDYLKFSHIDIKNRESPNICELVWQDKLELFPLKYVPDLSGSVLNPYEEVNAEVLYEEKNVRF